ncbi:hypothetical protein ACVIHC_004949 [Bradyrhizobium diazoefficiens]
MSEISPASPSASAPALVATRLAGAAAGSHPAPVQIKPEIPQINFLYQPLIAILPDSSSPWMSFFGERNVRKMLHSSDGQILPTTEICIIFRTCLINRPQTSARGSLPASTQRRQRYGTPGDFADLGSRAAVDKTLQRLVAAGELRRIDRGLYDRPRKSNLTGKPMVPDYRAVIRAVARRDQARVVVDGMTAANDLGLTTAVPARIEVLVDARLKPIKLGKQVINFKSAAPSRLYWAGRPGMRVVQALYWMQDMMAGKDDRQAVENVLSKLFANPQHGKEIRDDLRAGLSAMPIWMQDFLRPLLEPDDAAEDHA